MKEMARFEIEEKLDRDNLCAILAKNGYSSRREEPRSNNMYFIDCIVVYEKEDK